ncbi:MAG: UDP-N-acetylglucosamine 2-epimerase (non-hydrolyzing) [Flavobacteriales bacterium]|nr:UDP-N-acetylglucosamine 2-epimerase (non-hydrolyzing) [Flavobacteriales bacterium]
MIVSVFGARPQFVKAAVLSRALSQLGIKEKIIHTGQHYDDKMSSVFFTELGLPGVEKNLHVGSGNHGEQTGRMMMAIEQFLLEQYEQVKAVLVYGDTNSTIAGALVAAKLHIPVIHVEAGLRSYNRLMPEEVNRVLTDHLSAALFCSSETGVENLAREGLTNHVYDVGDIMQDAVNTFLPIALSKNYDTKSLTGLSKYNLITVHRPENTDHPEKMNLFLEMISQLDGSFIWPVHPRNNKSIRDYNIPPNLTLCEPFSYLEMLTVLNACESVITDSGGMQKEAYWLKKPCITIREQTEWVETLHNNWNKLSPILDNKLVEDFAAKPTLNTWKPLYGDGKSGITMAETIKKLYY